MTCIAELDDIVTSFSFKMVVLFVFLFSFHFSFLCGLFQTRLQ